MRTENWPWDSVWRKFLVTLTREVSVKWWEQKPALSGLRWEQDLSTESENVDNTFKFSKNSLYPEKQENGTVAGGDTWSGETLFKYGRGYSVFGCGCDWVSGMREIDTGCKRDESQSIIFEEVQGGGGKGGGIAQHAAEVSAGRMADESRGTKVEGLR